MPRPQTILHKEAAIGAPPHVRFVQAKQDTFPPDDEECRQSGCRLVNLVGKDRPETLKTPILMDVLRTLNSYNDFQQG